MSELRHLDIIRQPEKSYKVTYKFTSYGVICSFVIRVNNIRKHSLLWNYVAITQIDFTTNSVTVVYRAIDLDSFGAFTDDTLIARKYLVEECMSIVEGYSDHIQIEVFPPEKSTIPEFSFIENTQCVGEPTDTYSGIPVTHEFTCSLDKLYVDYTTDKILCIHVPYPGFLPRLIKKLDSILSDLNADKFIRMPYRDIARGTLVLVMDKIGSDDPFADNVRMQEQLRRTAMQHIVYTLRQTDYKGVIDIVWEANKYKHPLNIPIKPSLEELVVPDTVEPKDTKDTKPYRIHLSIEDYLFNQSTIILKFKDREIKDLVLDDILKTVRTYANTSIEQ